MTSTRPSFMWPIVRLELYVLMIWLPPHGLVLSNWPRYPGTRAVQCW